MNEEQNAVLINVKGVSVQFECHNNENEFQKVTVKISKLYKNQQCGICGHYDDNSENELRMSNNKNTQNLMQFHRSYTLKDQECESKSHEEFYSEQNKKEFSIESRESSKEYQDKWNSSSEEEQKWRQRNYNKQLKSAHNQRENVNKNQRADGNFLSNIF